MAEKNTYDEASVTRSSASTNTSGSAKMNGRLLGVARRKSPPAL